jgi:hypothetical protein
MSCCLPGAYDATDIFVWHDCYDEQDLSSIHAEALNSLLVIGESIVENFDLSRILQGPCRGGETDAVLAKVHGGFAIVPFVLLHTQNGTGYR